MDYQEVLATVEDGRLPIPFRKIAKAIGRKQALNLCMGFPPGPIYIPDMKAFLLRFDRDNKIRNEYDGTNVEELALTYGVGYVWVLQLIKGLVRGTNKRADKGRDKIHCKSISYVQLIRERLSGLTIEGIWQEYCAAKKISTDNRRAKTGKRFKLICLIATSELTIPELLAHEDIFPMLHEEFQETIRVVAKSLGGEK